MPFSCNFGRFFFVLLFAGGVLSVQGKSTHQVMLVDSLEQILEQADSSDQLELLFQLYRFTQDFSPELSLKYLLHYKQLSDDMQLHHAQAQARFLLSEVLMAQNQTDSAVQLLRQAVYFKHNSTFDSKVQLKILISSKKEVG